MEKKKIRVGNDRWIYICEKMQSIEERKMEGKGRKEDEGDHSSIKCGHIESGKLRLSSISLLFAFDRLFALCALRIHRREKKKKKKKVFLILSRMLRSPAYNVDIREFCCQECETCRNILSTGPARYIRIV